MNEKKLFSDIVLRFSKESHCVLYKVAAIAVKNGRIIATGINGTHSGRENCDSFHMKMWEKTTKELEFEEWIKTKQFRDAHHKWAEVNEVHAEFSLCGESVKNGISLFETDIYITYKPCMHCTKLLATFKPKNIFYLFEYDKAIDDSVRIFEECGINISKILLT